MEPTHQDYLQGDKNKNDDLSPSVEMAIRKIAEKGYLNYKIYTKKIRPEGGNYLGLIYEVLIEGMTSEEQKETNLFIKQAIPTNDNLKLFSVSELYSKEEYVYRELAEIFNKLQNEAQVSIENRLKMVRYYNESKLDAMILENMSKKGFRTYGKMDIISLRFAELSLQQLAKFHGLSFVIEKKIPNYFEKKIKTIKHLVAFNDYYLEFIEKMYELSSKKLTLDVKTKINKHFKSICDAFMKCMHGTMTKVKCLCHGDFKVNNVLFKEINGEVSEVVLVDYQFIYYGSPIIDFLNFAFVGTDQKFRKNHLNHLKDVYHDSLKKFLKQFSISVDEAYPRNMFESDFKNCLVYSFINSIVLLPFYLTAEDATPDFGREDLHNMGFKVDDRFYDRIHEIFDDFIEWGYL